MEIKLKEGERTYKGKSAKSLQARIQISFSSRIGQRKFLAERSLSYQSAPHHETLDIIADLKGIKT
jgi:hypothetical protein